MKGKKALVFAVCLSMVLSVASVFGVVATGSALPDFSAVTTGTAVVQDFEGTVNVEDIYSSVAGTVVDRASGGKWMDASALTTASHGLNQYGFSVDTTKAVGMNTGWTGYRFYVKTAGGAVTMNPNLIHHTSLLYTLVGDITLIDTTGATSTVTADANGKFTLPSGFEGWVVVPQAILKDAWGQGNDPTTTALADICSVMILMEGLGTGVTVYVDDFGFDGPMAAQDFEGAVNTMDIYGTVTGTVVDRASGGKWMDASALTAESHGLNNYSFSVNSAAFASVGTAWDGYAFYIETAGGAIDVTPNLIHHTNLLYIAVGEVTLIDTNGATSTVTADANGKFTLPSGFAGWVVVPRAILKDAWGQGNNPATTSLADICAAKLDLLGLGTGVTVHVDNLYYLSDVEVFGSEAPDDDDTSSDNTSSDPGMTAIDGSYAWQDFEGEITAARYSQKDVTTVDRPSGGKWLQSAEATSYAFEFNYQSLKNIGTAWDGYAFYVKTTGAATLTPNLDHWFAIQADGASDRLYIPSGEVTLINSAGQTSTVTASASGEIAFVGEFEGWVIIDKDCLIDAWGGDATTYNIQNVPGGSIGSMLLGVALGADGVVVNVDDISILEDVATFIDENSSGSEATIEITAQPVDQPADSGKTATFSITAASSSGSAIAYQWQISTDDGATWTNIDGATVASYTTPAVAAADHGTKFRCLMMIEDSSFPTTSGSAMLWVDSYPAQSVDFELGSDPINASVFEAIKGKNLELTINVTDGGETVYTWVINGKDITEATDIDPTIEIKDVADIGLDETAPDALYLSTEMPIKAQLTVDTSFNFFEDEDLFLYGVGADGKLIFVADGLKSGVSTTDIVLNGAGEYLLNNAELEASSGDGTSSGGDVTETGVSSIAVVMAVLLFGAGLAVIIASKKSVKTK